MNCQFVKLCKTRQISSS